MALPAVFLERLEKILPAEIFQKAEETFFKKKPLTARINTLRTSPEDVLRILDAQQIPFQRLSWCEEAIVISRQFEERLKQTALLQKGFLYIQGLSSMLPVLALDPQPQENILDMCAAPGSKATHLAALMHNKGRLLCLDNVKARCYKLKSVVALLGAQMIHVKYMDGRKFRAKEGLFDRILIDAPCSSEGRFQDDDPETYLYWSPRKIQEMRHKQRGLLLNASRLLKPNGILVYSTCTFSPEENEGVIDWLLRKTKGTMTLLPMHIQGIKGYPPVMDWQEKNFDSQVKHCWRVLPDETKEGFFIAKLIKHASLNSIYL